MGEFAPFAYAAVAALATLIFLNGVARTIQRARAESEREDETEQACDSRP